MTTLTYSEAQSLVNNNELSPGGLYYITDRKVILTAINSNQFSTKGIYLYSHGAKAWGAIELLTWSSNATVDHIYVDADDILSGPETLESPTSYSTYDSRNTNIAHWTFFSYDTSLFTLAQQVVDNINSAQSTYKAYTAGKYIVIQSIASGTGPNNLIISGSGTNVTLGNAINMNYGTADPSSPFVYECDYNFVNDKLFRLYDPLYNNEIRQDINFQNANDNSILDFNWNQSNVYNNHCYNSIIFPNFLDSTSKFFGNEAADSIIGANILQNTSLVYDQTLKTAEFQQNIFQSNCICMGNELVGGNDGYHKFIPPSSYPPPPTFSQIYNTTFNYNELNNSTITSNKMFGGVWFNHNSFTSNACFFSNIMTYFAEFSWNTASGSTARIYNNRIAGWFSFLGNTFNPFFFYDVYCEDDAFFINNTFSNGIIDDGILANTVVVDSSFSYFYWVIHHITSLVLGNLSINGTSSAHRVLETADNPGRNFLFWIQCNGTTGHGASGDIIDLIMLRQNDYVYAGRISNRSLQADAGAQISIGLESQNTSCVLVPTNVSTIKSNIDYPLSPTPLAASAEKRKLQLRITGGSLNSGYLLIYVETLP